METKMVKKGIVLGGQVKYILTEPKPEFSEFYIHDESLNEELTQEKISEAIDKWLEACRQWREINHPALVKLLTETTSLDEKPLPSDETDTPNGGVGQGYTILVWKAALAYIGILLGYQIFKVFL